MLDINVPRRRVGLPYSAAATLCIFAQNNSGGSNLDDLLLGMRYNIYLAFIVRLKTMVGETRRCYSSEFSYQDVGITRTRGRFASQLRGHFG
jgi:hypothetical protein